MTLHGCLLYLLFGLLASAGVPSHAQDDDFTLELKKIFPCQPTNQDANVSLYRSDILAVQADLTSCGSSWNISQYSVSCHSDSAVSLYISWVLLVEGVSTSRTQLVGGTEFGWPAQPINLLYVQGFRMHTESETNSTYPVVFIARQSSNGTLSFGIPLQPEG